ncbi:MAG: hypothetical protein ACUVXB_09160 [Bryobacteraceae bacterium]
MNSARIPRRHFWAALCMLGGLGACRSYADFTLPPLRGPQPPLPQFRWKILDSPVLPLGKPGDWDGVDVLNPSVILHEGVYYNLYSGFDGKLWHTGLATSPDGLHWMRRGRVLSPTSGAWDGDYIAANGSALFAVGEFLYWYQGGRLPAIGLARSKDAIHWSKHRDPVLAPGPRGSWDERGVADPYVVRFGEWFYLYYLGQDRARRQRLGVARSRDGVRWEKLRSNPILELGEPGAFDEAGLGEPAVWRWEGRYWMAYTGRDRREHRRIGLAWSEDGIRWRRMPAGTVLAGTHAWNAKVVCDPSVLVENGRIRVWFGGGDQPKPDEHLNGQIGYATLEAVGDTLSV